MRHVFSPACTSPSRLYFFITVLLAFITLASCEKSPVEPGGTTRSLPLSRLSNGDGVSFIYQTDGEPFSWSQDFGAQATDVYFIFTNPETGFSMSKPDVVSSISGERSAGPFFSSGQTPSRTPTAVDTNLGVRGIAQAHTDAARIAQQLTPESSRYAFDVPPPVFSYSVGTSTHNFMTYTSYASGGTPATLRKQTTKPNAYGNESRTLYIWVADDCWTDGGTRANLINQELVDLMSDSFLDTTQPAIYEWITEIFGEEWGSTPYANSFIADTGEIHILLYDIDADNSTNGGTLGYFWGNNNLLESVSLYEFSDERLLFAMDAVMFAEPSWQDEIISTLAHEFQHMIHFYQKVASRVPSIYSETWLNEMCSLVAEDLVADKLGIPGPRGVPLSGGSFVYSSGSGPYAEGRLPLFNYWNDWPLTTWNNDIEDYAAAYAFGGFLLRHFGSEAFVDQLMASSDEGAGAVTRSIQTLGFGNYSFGDIMRLWGAAVLLSNETTLVADTIGYGYNSGSAFVSGDYSLGSINLYNYQFYDGQSTLTGPYIYDLADIPETITRATNILAYAGQFTGLQSWDIDMPPGMLMTVIVR